MGIISFTLAYSPILSFRGRVLANVERLSFLIIHSFPIWWLIRFWCSGKSIIRCRGRPAPQLGRKSDSFFFHRCHGDVHWKHLGFSLLSFSCLRFHHPIEYNQLEINWGEKYVACSKKPTERPISSESYHHRSLNTLLTILVKATIDHKRPISSSTCTAFPGQGNRVLLGKRWNTQHSLCQCQWWRKHSLLRLFFMSPVKN